MMGAAAGGPLLGVPGADASTFEVPAPTLGVLGTQMHTPLASGTMLGRIASRAAAGSLTPVPVSPQDLPQSSVKPTATRTEPSGVLEDASVAQAAATISLADAAREPSAEQVDTRDESISALDLLDASDTAPGTVATPDDLAAQAVVAVACGGWFTVAVTAGSFLAADLRAALPPPLCSTAAGGPSRPEPLDVAVLGSALSDPYFGTCPAPLGGYDTVLWPELAAIPTDSGAAAAAGVTPLRAHAALLAARSPRLRALLEAEAASLRKRALLAAEDLTLLDSSSSAAAGVPEATSLLDALPAAPSARPIVGMTMHIPLPTLSGPVAALCLEWIYTDTLRTPLVPGDPRARELRVAATELGLARLEAICKLLIASPLSGIITTADSPENDETSLPQHDDDLGMPSSLSDSEVHRLLRIAATDTLAPDLALALLDTRWYDVIFVAGECRFPAHRVVVCARSAYFRSLLTSRGAQADQHGQATSASSSYLGGTAAADVGEVIEVEVPDSPAAFARFLIHTYTGYLAVLRHGPSTTRLDTAWEGQSLRAIDAAADLVTADRYGCLRYRSLVQHAVPITTETAPRTLELADAIGAPALRERATRLIVQSAALPVRSGDRGNSTPPEPATASALAPSGLHAAGVAPAESSTRQHLVHSLRRQSPHLAREVMLRISERDRAWSAVVLRRLDTIQEVDEAASRRDEASQAEDVLGPREPFPWGSLALLVGLASLYVVASRLNVALGWFVPAVNVIVFVVVIGWSFRGIILQSDKP